MSWFIPLRWRVFSAAILVIIIIYLKYWITEEEDDVLQYSQNPHLDSTSDDDVLPSMHLLMEPGFNYTTSRPEPIAINITMSISTVTGRFAPGYPLLTLPLKISRVPSARYDADTNPLSARDGRGELLRLSYRDEDPEYGPRVWYIEDDGGKYGIDITEVVVTFTAPYRRMEKSMNGDTRVDLRRDISGGGLVGQGISFIPVPPPPPPDKGNGDFFGKKEGDEGWLEAWDVTLEWDLSDAPLGIRGAWSFGDESVVRTTGTLDRVISHAIFAIGYLQRFPDWDIDISSSSSSNSLMTTDNNILAPTYWLDPSPYNITDLARQTHDMYGRIAGYFNTTEPLRVFLRRIESTCGGTGATQSFLLEYSTESVGYMSALSLADLLAHETVHEFALLDPDPPGPGHDPAWQEDEGAWYIEGVASYLGDLVGLYNSSGGGGGGGGGSADDDWRRRRSGMIQSLNNNAQAYYTAPQWALEMDYGDVLTNFWRGSMDITRVSYYRGFMFLAQLDGLIRKATGRAKSMDDVVLGLYALRKAGKPCTLDHLKDMAANLIGQKTFEQTYTAFFTGELVVPSEDCLERHGLKLVKMEWQRFELGIDPASLGAYEVRGLVRGSNAEKAGVREGDQIVTGFMVWPVQDDLYGRMKLTVLRDGQDVDLEWWPRSEEVVEAYGWVELDEDAPPDEL